MTTSACITIDCGYGHDLNLSPELDGTVTYYGLFFRPFKGITLTRWTWRDLQIASEYVQSRQDYYKAERGFYHVLYQRACMKPNYPMPAIDYYNSSHPIHQAIGNLMEWTIPVDVQLMHRG